MKKDIHPKYYPKAKIVCACGNTMNAGSTSEETYVEICSACHPFYTGKQKLIDSARRVDKFQKRVEAKSTGASGKKVKKEKQKKIKQAKKTKTEKEK